MAYLPDGCATYERYREGSGEDLIIDFEKAYRQDANVHRNVDEKMAEAIRAALEYYGMTGNNSFSLTGSGTGSTHYPCTENWQKAIGGHVLWNSMDVSVSESTMTIEVTVHELDRYNFDAGKQDIATGTSDEVNGRFEKAGWAKSFLTRGTVTREIVIDLDSADSTNISLSADSVTVKGEPRVVINLEGENR